MPTWDFPIEIRGSGPTIEGAWNSAIANLMMDPGPTPDESEARRVPPEEGGDDDGEEENTERQGSPGYDHAADYHD